MTGAYVLDANALLDFLEDGPSGQRVEQVMREGLRHALPVLVSVLNLGEVFYHTWQERGEEAANRAVANLERLPLTVVAVNREHAMQAGEIKARHKIPYVDCVTAALAMKEHAILVTGDRDFEKLGRRIQVLWLPRA